MTSSSPPPDPHSSRGPLAWMVHNRVTPNLLMLFLLLGGLFTTGRIKQEVFTEFDFDRVTVSVAYPGASPEEVEQGIVLSIEEVVRGLDGVDEVSAEAAEGFGRVNIDLLEGVEDQKVYQDIKQEVDRIRTFPEDAEEPQVTLRMHRHEVLKVQLFGETNEWTLRNLAGTCWERATTRCASRCPR